MDVVGRNLEKRFSASKVSFWFVDMLGRGAVRLPRAGTAGQARGGAQRIGLAASVCEQVLRSQLLHHAAAAFLGESCTFAGITR
ncbi:hypothetical protein [Streptomyces collinus]|uniref:hypothetical protein n=1 Tax=Streptomyces collinus TaxID=42684 RepID=UPI003424F79A